MIPITLQIKNFLSYGAEMQTIDFGPYPLICLSGKNGHGKSALLDAITWALWGQARKTAGSVKPDQGLLRLGQTQMMVVFDFELNGTTYRVRREFALTYGKPYAQLEFGMLNKETQAIIPLTNKTIRATQDIIDQTLKLDFDAFTNSAFLRQGQANEFSKKSSKDRKEILAAILGLGQYELLRKRALDKIRTAGAEKQSLTTILEKYSLELAQKEPLTQQLELVNLQLISAAQQEQELETISQQIDLAEKALAVQKQAASIAQFKFGQLTAQHTENQHTLTQHFSLWRTIHRKQRILTHQAASQATLLARKKELTQLIAAHQQALQQQLELKQRHLEHTVIMQKYAQEIAQAHALITQQQQLQVERLSMELKHGTDNQRTGQEQLAQITREHDIIKKEHALLAARLQNTALESELQAQELIFERRKEFYQQFRMRGTLISTELQNSAQKKQLVHNEQDPSCPLCEQNLTAARRRFLQNKFTKSETLLVHQRNRLITVVKKLKEILVTQHEQIQQLRAKIQEQATLKHKLADSETALQKSAQVINTLGEQLQAGDKKNTELSVQLVQAQQAYTALVAAGHEIVTKNSAYCALSATVENLEKQLAATPYQSAEHASAQRRLEELDKIVEEYAHIEREVALQEQRKQDILQLCAGLRSSKAQLVILQEELVKYSAVNTQQAELNLQKSKHAQERKQLHISKEQILQDKGSIQSKLLALATLEQEKVKQQLHIDTLGNTILDYQAIAAATGKDGIQALLIEDAIPEIEHEANELLKKLTNNQAQIFIESLRDLKKGGTKETLDINISDAAGIRAYELFSGGEAFRIDFALRIAISKLLARRAGTALQTLIIDEGFGSQDEEGLGHIMDAIYKIQDDFAKVIIVSHLPAMKEQFPVHFVVEKSAEGSVVKILEQD